jgi:Xaa-Pro aminopeptidase
MQSEFQQRRQQVLAQMVPASAALFFSAEEQIRSRDTYYSFHQDSDFAYLSGFNEPQALLILIKNAQGVGSSVLLNRPRDPLAEKWEGRRLGPEAAIVQLGIDQAFSYDTVSTQLVELLNQLTTIYHALGRYAWADQRVFATLDRLRQGKAPHWRAPVTLTDWQPWLHEMRLFKSATELDRLRCAGQITVKAHCRAMQQCRPGLFEYQVEAEIHHEFARNGARYPAYNTIVGSGHQGCILHYTDNQALLQDGDLVLIDAGCSYQGYASDVTRTFPINGHFTPPQGALYDLVLQMQQVALQQLTPGRTFGQANQAAIEVLVPGLVRLGLLRGESSALIADQAYREFYCHNLGHWLGLDVHDVGSYQASAQDRLLEPGMVLTVEPGLYIDLEAAVPSEYQGLGIRIEDTVLITPEGYELLTPGLPKQRSEIEALMRSSYTLS